MVEYVKPRRSRFVSPLTASTAEREAAKLRNLACGGTIMAFEETD